MYIIIADIKLFLHIFLEVLGALVSTNDGGRNSDSSGGVNCIQYVVTYIMMVATFARTGENNVLGMIMWSFYFQREVNGKGDRDTCRWCHSLMLDKKEVEEGTYADNEAYVTVVKPVMGMGAALVLYAITG